MINRCYILGAGFSKVFGLPLASELTKLIFNHAFPESDSDLHDVREKYLHLLKTLYPTFDGQSQWADFEDLITLIDELDLYCSDYAEEHSPCYSHFKEVMLKSLALYLNEKSSFAETEDTLLDKFCQRVYDDSSGIISFNWDVVIENKCYDLDMPVSYIAENDKTTR